MANIEEISQEMDRLKKTLDEAERNEAKFTGQQEILAKRLKDEFGLSSVSEAEIVVADLEEQEKTISKEIEKEFKSLQEAYEW